MVVTNLRFKKTTRIFARILVQRAVRLGWSGAAPFNCEGKKNRMGRRRKSKIVWFRRKIKESGQTFKKSE